MKAGRPSKTEGESLVVTRDQATCKSWSPSPLDTRSLLDLPAHIHRPRDVAQAETVT